MGIKYLLLLFEKISASLNTVNLHTKISLKFYTDLILFIFPCHANKTKLITGDDDKTKRKSNFAYIIFHLREKMRVKELKMIMMTNAIFRESTLVALF